MRIWNLSFRNTIWNIKAHEGFVRGLSIHSDGESILSCGDDKKVIMWPLDVNNLTKHDKVEEDPTLNNEEPVIEVHPNLSISSNRFLSANEHLFVKIFFYWN